MDSIAHRLRPKTATAVLLITLAQAAGAGQDDPPHSQLISIRAGGSAANGSCSNTAISANGRFVAFSSTANNLVDGDDEAHSDVFVVDRKSGAVERVSVTPLGDGANSSSYCAGISANGRFVLFQSMASDLVDGVSPVALQAFLRDRKQGRTEIVSRSSAGDAANAYVGRAGMSSGARFVAFTTDATNVTGDPANGSSQVYLLDRKSGVTKLVSVAFDGDLANADCDLPRVSTNGRLVFWQTTADNLIPADQNQAYDVFVRDRKRGTTVRVSNGSSGELGDGADSFEVTSNGRIVAFLSDSAATDLPSAYRGAYVVDRKRGTIGAAFSEGASVKSSGCDDGSLSISKNGRYVTFNTYYTDVVVPDPSGSKRDVFLADRKLGAVSITTLDKDGLGIDADCDQVAISGNGKVIAFASSATDLVTIPTLGKKQVYIVER